MSDAARDRHPRPPRNRSQAYDRRPRPLPQADRVETVVGDGGKLQKELRLGSLVLAEPDVRVSDIPDRPLVAVPAAADREESVRAFRKYDRIALPVTDRDGLMFGIIIADDVLDVADSETTEDIQKAGEMDVETGTTWDRRPGDPRRAESVDARLGRQRRLQLVS